MYDRTCPTGEGFGYCDGAGEKVNESNRAFRVSNHRPLLSRSHAQENAAMVERSQYGNDQEQIEDGKHERGDSCVRDERM